MYNASQEYWDKIKEQDRVFELNIRIEHENGTLKLTDEDIEMGSFKVIDSTQTGEDFTVGGTTAKHMEFTIVNKNKYEGVNFIGSKVIPTVSLLIEESIDAHFIQPSQPSKMKGFEDVWEHIPLGQFNVDIADRLRSTIEIKAIDNMILLDKPYSVSNLSYPATLSGIVNDACNIVGVGIPSKSFVNSNYVVEEKPEGNLTLRNIVGFAAELAGSYAKFDRFGRLHMGWYEETDTVITKHQRIDYKQSDYKTNITGISFDSGEKDEDDNEIVYVVGKEDYMIDISGNPLLQDNYDTALPKILDRIEHISFIPYSTNWQGNPAIDAGDILTHIDLDGKEHRAVVTNNEYVYRGISSMYGKALPNISRGYQSRDNRIANIIDRIEGDVESGLTNLGQEQLKATELIGNMLGGHYTRITNLEKDKDLYEEYGAGSFIHDAPGLPESMKIWKWGIGGFGYSEDGGKTYGTGITAENSIVADLVAANIITADMVRAGRLQSEDNSTWIDLNNGAFSFKGQMVWDSDSHKLIMGDDAVMSWDSIVDKPDIPSSYTDAKALQAWEDSGYSTYINSDGVYTGTVTANKVRAGKLQSINNSTWIDLDDGTFNFRDLLKWTSDGLKIKGRGLRIVDPWGEEVFQGDSSGNLTMRGNFRSYSSGLRALEMDGHELLFYNWGNKSSNSLVGAVASFQKHDNAAPYLSLAHERNNASELSHEHNNVYYPYISLDYDGVFTSTEQWAPITMWEPVRMNGTTYYGSSKNNLVSANKELLLLKGNSGIELAYGGQSAIRARSNVTGYREIYAFDLARFSDGVSVSGNLNVLGRKDGLSKTSNYGERLISAYETTEYYYGDIGSGAIGQDAECLIHIDEMFQECVNTNINYHVFIQEYNGTITNVEKQDSYFIVYGEPGTKFSWELKAKRLGYENTRLEVPIEGANMSPTSLNLEDELEDSKSDVHFNRVFNQELEFDLSDVLLDGEG